MRRHAYLLGFLPALLALSAALVVLLLPLPTWNELGSPAGWCGPGYTSDSAVEVLINPGVVNIGDDEQTDPDRAQQFEDYCIGQAKTRVGQAFAWIAGGGLLTAGYGFALLVAERRRRYSLRAVRSPG